MPAVPSQAPARIVGSYRLVRRLGAGASGEVWVGRHLESNGVAAVKILRGGRLGETNRNLFRREAKAIARLEHPHIVRVFEIGPEHLVTTLIDGATLERRMRSGLSLEAVLRVGVQIGSALAYAHAHGVVHRDIKPGNILVDGNGNAFLADFGLALLPDEPESRAVLCGTPSYMAPEQARGQVVGPPADQWALARTLLDALTGGGEGVSVDDALARLAPSQKGLREVLRIALRPAPDARWPDLNAFVRQLEAVDLDDAAAAVRLQPERRVLAPFGWAAEADEVTQVAPDIARASFRLSSLRAAAPGVDVFLRAHGYGDFGWSVYARSDRLGAFGPSALARAGECVVLLHGWLGTRAVWEPIALAVCRDNADAVVLVPDVAGFGASPFDAPTGAQLGAHALAETVRDWLGLLGLGELPTVLVGHSMSGLAVLTMDGAALGARVSRIAMTPLIFEVAGVRKWIALFGLLLFRLAARSPRLMRWLVRLSGSPVMAPGLGAHDLRAIQQQLASVPPRMLAAIIEPIIELRLAPTALRGVELVFGARDPAFPMSAAREAVRRFGGSADHVHVMASGGHFPHMNEAEHPEHTARNQDELVRLISSLLLSAGEGEIGSTVDARVAASS